MKKSNDGNHNNNYDFSSCEYMSDIYKEYNSSNKVAKFGNDIVDKNRIDFVAVLLKKC